MIHSKLLTKFAFSLALALAVVAVVTSVPVRLEAQAISGDLVGKITDASGAVLPNATVEAVNLGTSQKITTTTNANGEYHFINMPVGHYKVTASGNGLTGGYADVKVDLNKSATANITATVGAAATTVEVVEQAATIDTTTSTIQTNYDTKQAEDLPTASVGLGVLNLSLLQAGVGSSGGIGAGTGPAVSGQRPRNNNFTIEGVDNNSKSVTGPLVTIPNDAVESFTVLQNNFSPEFGHSSGGQFNTTIRSGSNKFHGRAYEYFQNRNLNAEDSQVALSQFNAGDKVQNPRYDNNRFGGQVGGPVIKDKLFFFTNWEYQPVGAVGGASSACAPTAAGYAALAGMPGLSANNLKVLQTYLPAAASVDTANCGSSDSTGNYGQFAKLPKTDPNYKDAPLVFGYDVTGAGKSIIPLGSVGFAGPNFSNGLTTVNSVDFNPTSKDQIRFRYIYIKQTFSDTAAQLSSFWLTDPALYHVSTFSEYHTFSPTITNEFRLGFNRYTSPTPVGPQVFPGLAMFPNITLDDLRGVNIGPNGNAPQGAAQNTYQLVDNVSWLRGKHNLKFGMEARKYISPQTFTQRVRGDYYYCGFACDKTAPSASSLDEFLRDFSPTDFGERSTGNPVYAGDQYAIYGFGNDEWRATSHLTINLGLRYEYTGTPAGNGLQALNSIASVPGLINFARPRAQKKNFAPRVGFAFSPGNSGETSIRGGFAMSYDVIYDNLGILSLPPELSGTCDVGSPGGACQYQDIGFLANGGLPAGSGGVTPFATAAAARANTASFVPNQKLPYSESWNLGIQHIFAKKYIAEIRYVGSKGIHLPVQDRINRVAKTTATTFLPTFLAAPTQATLDALTVTTKCPVVAGVETCPAGMTSLNKISNYEPGLAAAGFNGASVVSFQPYGSSIYHGLQSQLTRNFTNGLQFQAAWTWSHMFDNSTADVFSTVLTPRRAQDWNNFAGERSVSALDHRHRITLEVVYDLPFFKKDSNWFKKNILGNWEMAPIYTFQSPEYATVRSGADSNLNGDNAGDRTIINPSGNPLLGSSVTAKTNTAGMVVAYLANNPNAYYIQAGVGARSTASRNTLALPRINNWDLTAVKRFSIREGMNFEFQAQALNVLNHAQFVPGSLNQINSLGYTSGEVTNMLQVNQPTFAHFKDVLSQQPRTMQLALKFTF
jgi:Carboxypeptidase regulatory-like domain